MKHILKEPLLHFLLLGIGLFIAYGAIAKFAGNDEQGRIVITQGHVESMLAGYARTRQRAPTSEELQGLIQERVREEVFYREARALGLDKDDPVIRRRLRQKMEFVTDDIVAQAQPSDEDLNTYLQAHPEQFRVPQQVTFKQVYLNPEIHGANLVRDAAGLLARLKQTGSEADVSTLGDSLMLDRCFDALTTHEVAKQFGDKFAEKLGQLTTGQWQGPVESSYGVHLVLVSKRTETHLPTLAEVRDAVRREWTDARREETNAKYYRDVLKRYTVIVEFQP